MFRSLLIWSCLIGMNLLLPHVAVAETYTAKLDRSQWYLRASIFECTLVHEIPLYGQGVFFHEAGEKLKFYTSVNRNVMAPGKAALVVESSDWRPGEGFQDLGYVAVNSSTQPLTVDTSRAESMMQGLLFGKTPTFTRKSLHSEDRVRVKVSSVNFSNVYDNYKNCVAGLLPVNFKQVERTRVNFTVDGFVLTPEDKKKLDKVLLYVNADSTVNQIFVDGHTDSSGRRIYNRRLSKSRAEAVTDYLVRKGIRAEMINTRYHGERYPVAKNNSKANKAANRRTTVLLLRGADQEPEDSIPGREI